MTESTGSRPPGRASDLFAPPEGSPWRLDTAAPPPPPAPVARPQTRLPAPPPDAGRPAPPPPPGVEGRVAPPPPAGFVGRDQPPATDQPTTPPLPPTVAPGTGSIVAPPPASAPAPSHAGRAGGLGTLVGRAAIGVLALAVLALGAWGASNRSSAQQWRTRGQADRAQLQSQVDAAEAAQATVVRDRTRLATLAAQNANLADRNTILADVVKGQPGLSAALDRCSAAIAAIKPGDLNTASTASTACAAVKTEAARLQKVADSLGL